MVVGESKKFNLDDLYIRFFSIAEKRITKSGRGVVSFISNHSWVSDPSFVVLRQYLLESFNKFWIENMHGNRKISEYGPDGRTSETIFAIPGFSVGIQQGVVTSLWVKTGKEKKGTANVLFRDGIDASKASDRRKQLLSTLDERDINKSYKKARPAKENKFSFRPSNVSEDYLRWVKVNDLCVEKPLVGVEECRGGVLIDFDRENISKRLKPYFDKKIKWEVIRELEPRLSRATPRYNQATQEVT